VVAEQGWTEDAGYLLDGHTMPKGGHALLGDTAASPRRLPRAGSDKTCEEKGCSQSGSAWPGHSSSTDSFRTRARPPNTGVKLRSSNMLGFVSFNSLFGGSLFLRPLGSWRATRRTTEDEAFVIKCLQDPTLLDPLV